MQSKSSNCRWISAFLFAVSLSLCLVSGAAAAEILSDSEMIIMRPHKVGPTETMVYIKDDTQSDINRILRTSPRFIEQVRIYQQAQRENFEKGLKRDFPFLGQDQIAKMIPAYKPKPVYFVLDETRTKAVSFATEKPFGLIEAGSGGKTSFSVKAAPLVTLAADTISELKANDGWGYETVCHEMGHILMYPTHGLLMYPKGISENLIETMKKEGHWKSKITNHEFALLEGWAEFNGALFTGRPVGDYTMVDGRQKTADEMMRTEGVCAKILLDICKDTSINATTEEGYRKMFDTMRRHKPQTLNSFLVKYISDHPSEKAAVEKIVAADTRGAVVIDYDYGIRDWFAAKVQNAKNVWSVFKPWISGIYDKTIGKLFGRKNETATPSAAAEVKPFTIRTGEDEGMRAISESTRSVRYEAAPAPGDEELKKLKERQKALYDSYKKALSDGDAAAAEGILRELRQVNDRLE